VDHVDEYILRDRNANTSVGRYQIKLNYFFKNNIVIKTKKS